MIVFVYLCVSYISTSVCTQYILKCWILVVNKSLHTHFLNPSELLLFYSLSYHSRHPSDHNVPNNNSQNMRLQ